jgi:serine/threonine protein kinase
LTEISLFGNSFFSVSPLLFEMDAERLKQIEEIYHAALDIPEDKRESFFNRYCGEDENLRREIESLLSFEKTFDKFLDSPLESYAAEMFSGQKDETSLIDRQIGRYKIKKLLGKGGMGEVYLAEDPRLNRQVALKFLSASISADQGRLHRFEREALSVSALNHPNILTIYEFGEESGTYFLASEFVEGETLREALQGDGLSLKKILNIAEQTAFALAAAHKAGIVHRDIKPENIMIRSEDGIVKVLDFGLAKLTKTEDSAIEDESEAATRALVKTKPGMVMGTVSYMSPEQTRGLADIDARTDIWSLGAVLFEMLTGKLPFEGETMSDVIAAILKTEVPHISALVPNVPPEIDRIVEKCLQKDREERYQVSKDLALDLKTLLKEIEFSTKFARASFTGGKILTSEMPKQQTTVSEQIKYSHAPKIFLILLISGLLLGGAWWFFIKPDNTPPVIDTASLRTAEIVNWTSSPGEIYSVGSFSPNTKMVAFASTKNGTSNIWIKQTASGSGAAVQITNDEFTNKQPLWSPNGEDIAYYSTRGNQAGIWRIPQLGGSPKLVSAVTDQGIRLRFWSKNNRIFYESANEIFAIDVDSGQTKQITDLKSKGIKGTSLGISADEELVVFCSIEDKIWTLWSSDPAGKAPQKLFSGPNQIRNVVWHPDNRRIFYSSPIDGTFQIFVTDIYAAPPRQITFGERDSLVLEVSGDGTKILFGSAKEESDVWGVSLKDSKEFIAASDIDAELWADVSPDGKSIAYQSIKNLSQGNKLFSGNIVTKNLAGAGPPAELVSNGFLPKWSPDGKTLAYLRLSGDKIQIESIKPLDGQQRSLTREGVSPISNTVLPYNRLQTSDFSWSPDGRQIAYVSDRNGQNNIWLTSADGTTESQLTDNVSNLVFQCPLWSADGKRIAFTTRTNNADGKPNYEIRVIDTETKKNDPISSGNTFMKLIGWSTGGNDLFIASIEKGQGVSPEEISLRDLRIDSRKMSEIVKLKETYLYNIHLSPDKKIFAYVAHREGKDNVWAIPVDGGEARQLTGNNDSRLYFSSLVWSPDNNTIFFGKQSRYSLLSMLTNFK